jgi:hypothetical protein
LGRNACAPGDGGSVKHLGTAAGETSTDGAGPSGMPTVFDDTFVGTFLCIPFLTSSTTTSAPLPFVFAQQLRSLFVFWRHNLI